MTEMQKAENLGEATGAKPNTIVSLTGLGWEGHVDVTPLQDT